MNPFLRLGAVRLAGLCALATPVAFAPSATARPGGSVDASPAATAARTAITPVAAVRAELHGTVFLDRNGNGRLDGGERGIAGVAVSDQIQVVVTDRDGRYAFPSAVNGTAGNSSSGNAGSGAGNTAGNGAGSSAASGLSSVTGIVFVSLPDGYRATTSFYHTVASSNLGPDAAPIDFALTPEPKAPTFTFVHASDTHISTASVARTARLRALVDSIKPSFVIITGDLVRDALRVNEAEATGYYDLFQRETQQFTRPLWTVPGNHENFGIERDKSGVSASNPLYGRAMYRKWRGPDYYSFTRGGVHFVALNTVDINDQWYYGHVDSVQLEWLTRDLAAIPPTMPVVTFNHIPFFSSIETVNGYSAAPPAPSIITVNGKTSFRHTVSNARDVLARFAGHPYPLALAGHVHIREQLRLTGLNTRFDQVSAVIGPTPGPGAPFPSGIAVYRVTSQRISEGVFVPLGLDAPAPKR